MRRLTRREKWPLHVGLFLLYVLIQTISSVGTSKTNMTNVPLSTGVSPSPIPPIAKGQPEETPQQREQKAESKKQTELDKVVSTAAPKEIGTTESSKKAEEKIPITQNPMTNVSKTDIILVNCRIMNQEFGASLQGTNGPPTTQLPDARPTWRPRRSNCTAPAIEQFIRPPIGPEGRKHGGLILFILVAIYSFLGLAIVCDDYFVSSLDRICEGNDMITIIYYQI